MARNPTKKPRVLRKKNIMKRKSATAQAKQIKDGLFSSAFGCDNNKMEIRDAPHLIIIGNEPPNMDDRNFHPGKYIVREISEQVPYTTSTTKAPDGATFCECDDAVRDDKHIETQTVLTFD